jgi:hypothetical protein
VPAVFLVDLAVFVAHFAAAEVFGVAVPAGARCFAAVGIRAVVSVIGMEAGIDVAVEVVMAVVPGAGADEDAAGEPLGAVVPVGRAVVRGCGVVAIGANGSGADVDADLGIRAWSRYEQKGAGQSVNVRYLDPCMIHLIRLRGEWALESCVEPLNPHVSDDLRG